MPLSYDLTHLQILGQKFVKLFVGILVQTMTQKGHFEIIWPLGAALNCRFLVPCNTQKILTKIWHQIWDKNDGENICHWKYFQILRALSELPANWPSQFSQKGWLGQASLLVALKGLVGSKNNFIGIYFHHHYYLKTGVKSL